jgi:hypothetical protein
MPLHELKICPRCNQEFDCKVGDISRCKCSDIRLTLEVQSFIDAKYQDCVCVDCLQKLNNKYYLFIEKHFPGEYN